MATARSIKYTVYQDTKKGGTNKFYARAAHLNTIGTEELAQKIQASCTLKASDVIACIRELVETMKDELLAGNVVNLDGFGSFRVNIKSSGAVTEDEFTVTDNIKGCHVRFLPAGAKDSASGAIVRPLIQGVRFEKLAGYRK